MMVFLFASIVFSEDFEGGWPPEGWKFYELGDPAGWQEYTGAESWADVGLAPIGSRSMGHNDDDVTNIVDDWAVSPVFSLKGGTHAVLFFYHATQYAPSWTYYRGVWITTDTSGTPASFSELKDMSDEVSDEKWSLIKVPLDAYLKDTVRIAYVYQGDYSDEWYIDEIYALTYTHNLSLLYNNPDTIHAVSSFSLTPEITVTNEGDFSEVFSLSLYIIQNGDTVKTEELTDLSLSAGKDSQFVFSEWIPNSGIYTYHFVLTSGTDEVFLDNEYDITVVVHRVCYVPYTHSPPTLDGKLEEWENALVVDISDTLGMEDYTPQPSGTVILRLMHDSFYIYLGVEAHKVPGAHDHVGIGLDDDMDGEWNADSSEGINLVDYYPDSVVWKSRVVLPGGVRLPLVIRHDMDSCFAVFAASETLFFEIKIPVSHDSLYDPAVIEIQPDKGFGLFVFYRDGMGEFYGYWPQDGNRLTPSTYPFLFLSPPEGVGIFPGGSTCRMVLSSFLKVSSDVQYLEIVDLCGRVALRGKPDKNGLVNVSSLRPGVYYLITKQRREKLLILK